MPLAGFAQVRTTEGLLAGNFGVPRPTATLEKTTAGAAPAATLTISGQVLDDFEEPLVGATVMVKGSAIIITTDAAGRYTLTLPAGAYTLSYGSAGFYDKEIPARASVADLTVELEYRPDAFKRIKRR